MERQFPSTLSLRRTQPQPHQVPPWRRWRIVFVRCSGVEYMVVGQELDIAHVQNHVQRMLLACLLENGNGAFLGLGKSGDETCVREAGQGTDKVGVESVDGSVSLKF